MFGLIFDSFCPLKMLPNIYPPISEEIQPNSNEKSIIFNAKILEKEKHKTKQKYID